MYRSQGTKISLRSIPMLGLWGCRDLLSKLLVPNMCADSLNFLIFQCYPLSSFAYISISTLAWYLSVMHFIVLTRRYSSFLSSLSLSRDHCHWNVKASNLNILSGLLCILYLNQTRQIRKFSFSFMYFLRYFWQKRKFFFRPCFFSNYYLFKF